MISGSMVIVEPGSSASRAWAQGGEAAFYLAEGMLGEKAEVEEYEQILA